MNRIINSLIAIVGRSFDRLMHGLVEIVRAPKQNVESILTILFYCALFGSVVGTTVIRCQPALNGIWCIIAITGACYGFLLACLSIVCGMAVWCCMDLMVGTGKDFQMLNCVYGCGFAFAAAVGYWVVMPLTGTAISIIAVATVFPVLVIGYRHDKKLT
jgi:hypothetical protein